ncbi:MAG: hypothetical protein ACKO3L_06355, partial [Actinomycetota bacterium]
MKRLLAFVAVVGCLLVGGPVVAQRTSPTSSARVCTSSANLNVIESCALGTVGPGGGMIFYDAGKLEWWGRYLEAVALPAQTSTTW